MFLHLRVILFNGWGCGVFGFPACITGHMTIGFASGCRPPPPGYYGIRSTSGRYASYWNAFLFTFSLFNDISEVICASLDLQHFYRPGATKLRQGNILHFLCVSFCPGGACWWLEGLVWRGRGSVRAPPRHYEIRFVNARPVRILLECILLNSFKRY